MRNGVQRLEPALLSYMLSGMYVRRPLSQALAVFLTIVFLSDAQTTPPPAADTRTQISALPVGTHLDIRLKTGEKVSKARLVSVSESSFTVTIGKSPANSPRSIGFDDVQKFTAHQPTHTPPAGWIATGVIVGLAVTAVIIFAIFKHNE